MPYLDELLRRQAKRKTARKAWRELRSPDITLDQKDYESKRKALRTSYFNECHGVDADIDHLREALKLAVEENLEKVEGALRQDGELNQRRVNERLDEVMKAALPKLSKDNQELLEREKQRAEEAAEKQAKAEKTEQNKAAEEEARKAQIPIPFKLVEGEPVDESTANGADDQPLDVPLIEMQDGGETGEEPEEPAAPEPDKQWPFKDEEEREPEPDLPVEKLPPADGFKPEDSEKEGQPKRKGGRKLGGGKSLGGKGKDKKSGKAK